MNPKRLFLHTTVLVPLCLTVAFLCGTASWSQSFPKGFPVHPGYLLLLLGNMENGEPECYSVNLDDGNSDKESIEETAGSLEESNGMLRTPSTEEGWIGYKYLGQTKEGVHVLQVWENKGGTLTVESILLVRMEKHRALEEQNDQVISKEKRVLVSQGQIMLYGDVVDAKMENDVLTYRSHDKKRTLDLRTLQSHPNEDQVEEDGPELITTADMIEHEGGEFEKIDKELNRVYKKLMSTLDQEGQEKLRQSQRAWLAFRDKNADFAADAARGGSLSGILYVSAMVQMTQARGKELTESQRND